MCAGGGVNAVRAGQAVPLRDVCGRQDGASPGETQMWLNRQETDEIRTAISTTCRNMRQLENTEETKRNQADRQRGWSNAYATETKTKAVRRVPRLLATAQGVWEITVLGKVPNSLQYRFVGTSTDRARTGLRSNITSTNGEAGKLAKAEHDANDAYYFLHLTWSG